MASFQHYDPLLFMHHLPLFNYNEQKHTHREQGKAMNATNATNAAK